MNVGILDPLLSNNKLTHDGHHKESYKTQRSIVFNIIKISDNNN
jgi:hypothetical protein